MQRNIALPEDAAGEAEEGTDSPQNALAAVDNVSSMSELEEEFTCGICYELIVIPTSLNCGHSFCRHCLAHWFDVGKKTECPSCRTNFVGYPMENIHMMNSLVKLFGDKYTKRKEDVLDDKDNKKAIQDFENILKKRHKSDNLSATSCGCLIGTALVLVITTCLYMAVHWGSSEFDLLVKKPLVKWSVKDVTNWLEDLGLQSYEERFAVEGVNGLMLSQIEPADLIPLFTMSNPLHQRMFLHSLNYTKTYGVKQPTNLWEYKAIYSGYTTFLFYSMSMTPRLSLLYLYVYDKDSYDFYKSNVMSCNATTTDDSNLWWFYAGSGFAPYFIQAKFAYCFSDMHYWTSRMIILQCICKGLLDFIYVGTATRSPISINPFLLFGVYYFASCIWWLVPTILRDTLFYAEIYFSPLYVARELSNRLLRN